MNGLMFRNTNPGDMMPARRGELDAQYWPRVLRWFCPSLTEDESARLYQRAPKGVAVTAGFLRALVLDNIAELRASAEAESAKAMLLEAVALLPSDIRPMVRENVDRDILGGDWSLSFAVQHNGRRGGLVDFGDPVGSKYSLRDVSAEALAVRLEGLIRRWLVKHEVNRG